MGSVMSTLDITKLKRIMVMAELDPTFSTPHPAIAQALWQAAQEEQREEDAKLCVSLGNEPWADIEGPTPEDCAAAIRGQTK